jgi:hypothetical protein
VGPVAFVIVFMLIPLGAALFAGGFFAAVALYNVLSTVPTSTWAALTVGAGVVVAARLWMVVRALRSGAR